jgi:hypothetical protein
MFEEQHLRPVLGSYSLHHNEARTQLGLSKDAPLRRAVQQFRIVAITPVLAGLHHRYARI